MDSTQRRQLKKYVDLVVGKWQLIVACLLLSVAVGLIFYLRIPKSYQSTSVLSYERQQINPTNMDPEQGRNEIRQAVATLQEIVTSRNSLEKVINQFDLFQEQRKRLPIEDAIGLFRQNITIAPAPQVVVDQDLPVAKRTRLGRATRRNEEQSVSLEAGGAIDQQQGLDGNY